LCPCAGATRCSGPVATTQPGGFTTPGTTRSTVLVTAAPTTVKVTAAPTTVKVTAAPTAPPPGQTTAKPTAAPPLPTTQAPTQATCAPGTLGCKCDGNACAGGHLCRDNVCAVKNPCLYGELGCACTPGTNDCNSARYTCSPVSLQCIEKERGICDEKNGQKGCWCRENGSCDAGLRCDDTRNCVVDNEYTCAAGAAGCKCKEDETCDENLRCAKFSTETVCVNKDPEETTATNPEDVEGSSASTLVTATCAVVVALLAQF
jgi:hypothetical protein